MFCFLNIYLNSTQFQKKMSLLNSNFFEQTTIENKTSFGLNSKFLNSSAENSPIGMIKTLKGVSSGKRNIFCNSTPRPMNSDFLKNNSSIPSPKQKGSQYSSKKNSYEERNFQNRFFNSLNGQKKSSLNQNSSFSESSKQQVVSITYEEIGLFPRSFNRVFDRFFKQLFFDVENLVIQEYRFYRYLFLTTVKCLFILIFVPLGINFLAKNYLIRPVTEYYWNTHNHEIFLNSYQQKRAFTELKNFEEKIYFESLLLSENQIFFGLSEKNSTFLFPEKSQKSENVSNQDEHNHDFYAKTKKFQTNSSFEQKNEEKVFAFQNSNALAFEQNGNQLNSSGFQIPSTDFSKNEVQNFQNLTLSNNTSQSKIDLASVFRTSVQKRLQVKILELAKHYNEESIEAITNFFADVLSFITLCYLLVRLEIQINITKSFLLEVFFGLDDSKKSLLILFITDLLVGYHSPNIWELFFQTLFDHYGLPESQTTIFLLVATLPVLLDVLFKYLIFRHLNRASPATVATYHAMIE
uniref:envelope membrane protein n=1 Tax=Tetradesmus distendus TaxID=113531 RepID=UPI003002F3BC|nr:envelope membrane protein [Tetradesmus distendus]